MVSLPSATCLTALGRSPVSATGNELFKAEPAGQRLYDRRCLPRHRDQRAVSTDR